jgi:outer membrane protein OmpA-like peptidoglycan-associated protein
LLSELDLSGIRFRSGSTELDGDSLQILDEVVEVLNLVGDAQILIAGHTDSRGNADYNFSLSADRAAAVQQYLINRGIAAGRLTARGYGPTQPIATNDTAAGRALNRRIEIQLIGE